MTLLALFTGHPGETVLKNAHSPRAKKNAFGDVATAIHASRACRPGSRKASVSEEAAMSFNSVVALTYMINCVIQPFRSLSVRSVRKI